MPEDDVIKHKATLMASISTMKNQIAGFKARTEVLTVELAALRSGSLADVADKHAREEEITVDLDETARNEAAFGADLLNLEGQLSQIEFGLAAISSSRQVQRVIADIEAEEKKAAEEAKLSGVEHVPEVDLSRPISAEVVNRMIGRMEDEHAKFRARTNRSRPTT